MRDWIISNGISDDKSISEIEEECRKIVKKEKLNAWEAYKKPIIKLKN